MTRGFDEQWDGDSPTPRLSANMPTAHVIPMVVSQPQAKKRVKHSVFPFDGYHSYFPLGFAASP
jgi:hypothetical protein